jgi:hypothetical protein
MPLWAKVDEKDKTTDQPDGSWMLGGTLEVSGVDITLKAGQKLGLAIRRNKNKTDTKQPDYYGEIWAMNERTENPSRPQGGA